MVAAEYYRVSPTAPSTMRVVPLERSRRQLSDEPLRVLYVAAIDELQS